MNFKRIFGIVIVLSALAAIVPASGYAADTANDWTIYLRPAVRFGTDDRVIFIIDALAPVYRGDKDIVFINTKFSPDNHEAWEINAGVGYRRLVLDDKLVLGANMFYDHRKTKYGSHFNQLGLGFEAMAEPGGIGLTGRFNLYVPLNNGNRGAGFAYAFYGNGIYSAGLEEPMTGFDYEAGIRVPGVSNYVETWIYAGGYNFFGRHVPDVNGVSARLEVIPTDFMKLNFEYRNDNINHAEYSGEGAFEVPVSIENLVAGKNPFAGIGDVFMGSRTLNERMVEPVRRDVDIVVGKETMSPGEASEGDLVAGVIFVDASAPAGGDGSYEHPWQTLYDASIDPRLGSSAHIIHVLTGDGYTTNGAEFDVPDVTIWGAGVNNPHYTNVVNFVQGYPTITSTLAMNAQNMTVFGLYFDSPGDFGIEIGSGAANAGFSIFSNIIDYPNGYGIYYSGEGDLGTAGSPAIIRDNVITHVGMSFTGGMYLGSDGDIYAKILDNEIDGVRGNGITGIEVWTNGSFSGDIVGNRISDLYSYGDDGAYGIFINSQGGIAGSISNNVISDIYSGIVAAGIYASTNGDFSAPISGNIIDNIEADGNYDEAYGYGIYAGAGGDFTGSVSNNRINDIEAYDGYEVYAHGISLDAYGDFSGNISGNVITGVTGYYGLDIFAAGIAVNGDDWWYWNNAGSVSGSITGNDVSDIGAYDGYDDTDAVGILGYAGEDGYSGSISNNEVTDVEAGFEGDDDDDDDDMEMYAAGIEGGSLGDFSGSITGNDINDVSAYGDSGYSVDDVSVFGITGWADGNYSGSINNNTVAGLSAEYAYYDALVAGIDGSAFGSFSGSIFDNSVSDLSIDNSYYAYAIGTGINLWPWWYEDSSGSVTGSIYRNTVTDINIDGTYDAWAAGVFGYSDGGDYAGSIHKNSIDNINIDDVDDVAEAFGIYVDVNYGDLAGSVYDNAVSYITAEDAGDSGNAYGILTDLYSGDYTGSIHGNTVSHITALNSDDDYAYGIALMLEGDGTISGSTYKNTISYVTSENLEAYGIYYEVYGDVTGGVTNNTITYLDGGEYAYGVYLSIGGLDTALTGPVTGNHIDAVSDSEVYGLRIIAPILGSLANPMVVTGNGGTLRGYSVFAIYLGNGNAAASSVYIGTGSSRMGKNSFTSVLGNWDGNYPTTPGVQPIWANDNGSFINR